MGTRSYTELIKIKGFAERLTYLSLYGEVDSPRFISNPFYKSIPWLNFRKEVILRDNANDLGVPGFRIKDRIIIHHINPITLADLENYNVEVLLNPDNVIATSTDTHNKIHYSSKKEQEIFERTEGDTKLW